MKKVVLIFTLIPITVFGEYRVYQYYLMNRNITSKEGYIRYSTLDPVSFIAYNGGAQSIKVDLLRTWHCPGYTGFNKPICKGPLDSVTFNPKETP